MLSVCHVVGRAGIFSEVWLDAQVCGSDRYASSLLSIRPPLEPYLWRSRPDVLSRERVSVRLLDRLPQPVEVGRAVAPDVARALLTLGGHPSGDRPTVYHCHFGYVAYVWTGAAARADVPLVTSFYGVDAAARRFRSGRWKGRYRRLFAVSGAVLVEGPHMATRLGALGCPPEKIHVVRLPFAPPGALLDGDVSRQEYAACFGGRFVAKKGLDIALRAFTVAFRSGPERMLLVGAGPEEARLRGLAAELGIAERVVFRPPAPIEELAALMRGAHVALFPSVTAPDGDGEGGAPLVIPLAQSLGVPTIVSDHDDLPWAAAPGTPVVPSGDVDALAAALADVYRASRNASPELSRQLESARSFVLEAYDAVRLTAERETVYDVASG